MAVHNNPVKPIVVVRKIGGKLVVDVPGTAQVPIKLKLRLSSCSKDTRRFFLSALSKWALLTRHPYRGGLAIKLRRPRQAMN